MFLSCIGSTFTHGPTPWNQQAEISKSRSLCCFRPVAIEADKPQRLVLLTVYLVFCNLSKGNVLRSGNWRHANKELGYRPTSNSPVS